MNNKGLFAGKIMLIFLVWLFFVGITTMLRKYITGNNYSGLTIVTLFNFFVLYISIKTTFKKHKNKYQ